MSFHSEDERRKGIAIFQTAVLCLLLEALVLLVLMTATGSFLGALAASVFFLGPPSIWAAPAIYARILKASE